jgi:hypothetical protein
LAGKVESKSFSDPNFNDFSRKLKRQCQSPWPPHTRDPTKTRHSTIRDLTECQILKELVVGRQQPARDDVPATNSTFWHNSESQQSTPIQIAVTALRLLATYYSPQSRLSCFNNRGKQEAN